jgi:hypothetical protein
VNANDEPSDGYSIGVRTLADRPTRGAGFVFDGHRWVPGAELLSQVEELEAAIAALLGHAPRWSHADLGGEG